MLLSLLLLCVCVGFFLLQLKPSRPKNFPPGPSTLPIVGNLLDLNLENPLTDFKRLTEYYGSIYSLFIGRKPAVVLNGVKAIKEALVNNAVDFAGRPQDLLVNDITQRKGVIFIDYNSSWKEHRRFALMTLKNLGMGKTTMEDRIQDELQYTIETLEKNIGAHSDFPLLAFFGASLFLYLLLLFVLTGKCLNPQAMFHKTSLNIISQLLLGKRYEYGDAFMKDFVHYLEENTKIANGPWAMLYDSFPFIRSLPLPFQKCFENLQTVNRYIFDLLAEHKKTNISGQPRDFVDCYLDELGKKDSDSSFSEDQLVMFAHDLYSAGTDTTSNTMLTGFLYLACYPHIQDQCQQEIDQVVAAKGVVSFRERYNMPYMQAVIHEVQRIANVVPLSIFHCTTKDTELMGYSIPKGTMIIENLTSVLNEEGQWKFPHEFNPENFLNEEGEFVKPEAFLAFSAGPRLCPGEGLARMELFIIMVTLLRKFKFTWPEDAGEPDLTPVYGLTMSPRPYRVKVQLR